MFNKWRYYASWLKKYINSDDPKWRIINEGGKVGWWVENYKTVCEFKGKEVEEWCKADFVKPEEIEFCIGLKDKNNKDVYQGDYIATSTSHPLEVFWNGLAWCVRWKDCGNNEESIICSDDADDMSIDDDKFVYMEVIGNHHENPKLVI